MVGEVLTVEDTVNVSLSILGRFLSFATGSIGPIAASRLRVIVADWL